MSTTKTVSIQGPHRCSEGDMIDYGQSMRNHTKLLLTKASKMAEIHSHNSSLPHNSSTAPSNPTRTSLPSPIPVPSVARVPHANDHTPCKCFTRTSAPDPRAIEKAIVELNKMSIKPGDTYKTASIKTPFDPAMESKKKVLNRHGLRLTLDDRRPTVG